mgnify:CR=1 FL=1|jgi:hypothetical protein
MSQEQEAIEEQYSDNALKLAIRKDVYDCNIPRVEEGVAFLDEWLKKDHSKLKRQRLDQLKDLNLTDLVITTFAAIAQSSQSKWEPFVSISGQVAHKLGMDDHKHAITTTAEIVTILCYTGAFTLQKDGKYAQWMIHSDLYLSEETYKMIDCHMFLPPMVSKPKTIKNCWESPYYTFNEAVMTGRSDLNNNKNIGIDVINKQTNIALTLNEEFLKSVAELPPNNLDKDEDCDTFTDLTKKREEWDVFKKESEEVYSLMVENGNKFYLAWKPDQRLRLYAKGYHINPQGRPYKKAMIELHHKDIVTGVPNG